VILTDSIDMPTSNQITTSRERRGGAFQTTQIIVVITITAQLALPDSLSALPTKEASFINSAVKSQKKPMNRISDKDCLTICILDCAIFGFGNIVNTSSISGLIGRAGDMPYNVSKHGIVGLTETAALENADRNIRINCVCPSAIQTPWVKRVTKGLNELHPMKRIGQPEEVANAVIWLCSEDSSFVTGHSLVIDGGRIAGEW
jgi:NAD(P)-dependent dehydrogenase (short-subunit alcohol dehydrogenase family)